MYCSQCATHLAEDDVYCPNCSKTVVSFSFDARNIPQVESLDEKETQVRPKKATDSQSVELKPRLANSSKWIAGLVGGTIVLVGVIAFAVLAFVGFVNFSNRKQDVVKDRPVYNAAPEPTPKRTPTPPEALADRTPEIISIDEQRAAIDKKEDKERAVNARRSKQADSELNTDTEDVNDPPYASNSMPDINPDRRNPRISNSMMNSNTASYGPPPFDRNGKPLRAVCNDGSPSYWQYDQWATCLAKGGVRVWYRR